MKLRPYQEECVSSIINEWKTYNKTLAVVPTGGGKTIIFSKLVQRIKGRKLIIAHREELLTQARDKLYKATGLSSSLEKASDRASIDDKIVVGSIQTLSNSCSRFDPDHFDYIIVDEAHHTMADSYLDVLNYFDGAKVLGVTATPDREDQKNLGSYYQSICFERTLLDMINDKYLVPIKVKQLPVTIPTMNLKTSYGDYSLKSCGETIEPYLEALADDVIANIGERKTLIFLPLVATSKKMNDILISKGASSCHVDGDSKDRKQILENFTNDKYQFLCNSMLLTEGYDEPSVSCIVNLRLTKNRALYSQIVGRGTRLNPPHKEDLLILDFLFQSGNLPLVKPYHLFTGAHEVIEEIEKIPVIGEEVDVAEMVEEGENNREESLRRALEAQAKKEKQKKARAINALEFAVAIHDDNIYNYKPAFKWEEEKPTDKQIQTLERFGINTDNITNKGLATKVLGRIFDRQKLNLASPKQVALMKKWKIEGAEYTTFEDAKLIIGNRFNR